MLKLRIDNGANGRSASLSLLLTVFVCLSTCSLSSAQTTPAPAPAPNPYASSQPFKFAIGPEVGVYIPTGSKAASRFGSQWWSVGLGLGQITSPSNRGSLSADISLIARYSSTNHVYMVPAGVQYRYDLGSSSFFKPYVGVSADTVFADILSPVDNIHSGIKTRGAGSIFIGTKISSNSYIEARYLEIGEFDSLDLSGVKISAGIRF